MTVMHAAHTYDAHTSLQALTDLNAECTKEGTVLRILAPRPLDPAQAAAAFGTGQFGKAFIQVLLSFQPLFVWERLHARVPAAEHCKEGGCWRPCP